MAAYEEEISRHGERDIDQLWKLLRLCPQSPSDGKYAMSLSMVSLVYTYTLQVDLYLV